MCTKDGQLSDPVVRCSSNKKGLDGVADSVGGVIHLTYGGIAIHIFSSIHRVVSSCY